MSDLVRNPEDRFSHNEAQLQVNDSRKISSLFPNRGIQSAKGNILITNSRIQMPIRNTYSSKHKESHQNHRLTMVISRLPGAYGHPLRANLRPRFRCDPSYMKQIMFDSHKFSLNPSMYRPEKHLNQLNNYDETVKRAIAANINTVSQSS